MSRQRHSMSRAGSCQTRLMLRASIECVSSVEFHFGRLRYSFLVCHGKVRLLFHMEKELRRQVRGEVTDAFVVLRHLLAVALACNRDAVDRKSTRLNSS